MLYTYYILCGAAVWLLAYLIKKHQFTEQNMAPGPFRWPVIGTMISLFTEGPFLPWKAMDNMAKKHGHFFSMSVGRQYIVVLNSYEVMDELLQKDEWSGKFDPPFIKARAFGKELGLACVRTPAIWKEMRRFSQKTLRDFGFGKRLSMQGVIEAELADTVDEIKISLKKNNGILRIKNNFIISIINTLWSMTTGIRYSHDDPKLKALLELTFRFTKGFTFLSPLIIVPKLQSVLSKNNSIFQNFFTDLIMHLEPIVEERKLKNVYLTEPENYIDVFLNKIKETSKDPNSVYTEEQLIIMLEDFWMVGAMTTSSTLSYALFFLVLNPEIQNRVREEIDAHVPRHSIPTIEDIEKMPYTQAVILEIHRLACVVPIPIPRITTENVSYNGWKVPSGSIVISNHWSVLMDKKYWGDPEVFRPERFLNTKGEFVPDKHVVTFGFGKRYCIGVTLVNSIIPIFVTTLLQKFNISLVPGENPPNMKPCLGVNLSPHPFNVLMTERA